MPDEVNLSVRSKVLLKLVNSYLKEKDLSIKSVKSFLSGDLRDGILICNLVELLSQRVLFRWDNEPKTTDDMVSNLNIAIEFLAERIYVGVTAEQLMGDNVEAILGFIVTLVQTFILGSPHLSQKQCKLEILKMMSEKDIFLEKEGSDDAKHNPTNFGHDWATGYTLVNFINALHPDAIPQNKLTHSKKSNIRLAIHAATKYLNVPKIIDAEQIVNEPRDETSLFVFLCYCLNAINWKPTTEYFSKTEAKEELIRSESQGSFSNKSPRKSGKEASSPRELRLHRSPSAAPDEKFNQLMSNRQKRKKEALKLKLEEVEKPSKRRGSAAPRIQATVKAKTARSVLDSPTSRSQKSRHAGNLEKAPLTPTSGKKKLSHEEIIVKLRKKYEEVSAKLDKLEEEELLRKDPKKDYNLLLSDLKKQKREILERVQVHQEKLAKKASRLEAQQAAENAARQARYNDFLELEHDLSKRHAEEQRLETAMKALGESYKTLSSSFTQLEEEKLFSPVEGTDYATEIGVLQAQKQKVVETMQKVKRAIALIGPSIEEIEVALKDYPEFKRSAVSVAAPAIALPVVNVKPRPLSPVSPATTSLSTSSPASTPPRGPMLPAFTPSPATTTTTTSTSTPAPTRNQVSTTPLGIPVYNLEQHQLPQQQTPPQFDSVHSANLRRASTSGLKTYSLPPSNDIPKQVSAYEKGDGKKKPHNIIIPRAAKTQRQSQSLSGSQGSRQRGASSSQSDLIIPTGEETKEAPSSSPADTHTYSEQEMVVSSIVLPPPPGVVSAGLSSTTVDMTQITDPLPVLVVKRAATSRPSHRNSSARKTSAMILQTPSLDSLPVVLKIFADRSHGNVSPASFKGSIVGPAGTYPFMVEKVGTVFQISFAPSIAGLHTVTVYNDTVELLGSPKTFNIPPSLFTRPTVVGAIVTSAAPSMTSLPPSSNSVQKTTVGAWITPPVLERPSSFLVNGPLQFVNGTVLDAVVEHFSVNFEGSMSSWKSDKVVVQPRGDFLVEFVPMEVGRCRVTIAYNGSQLLSKPYTFHVRNATSLQVNQAMSELTTLVRSATSPRRGY